jgi:hypothetical protein
MMTSLLERAVSEIEKLPQDAQDAIAARLLADLADEQAWTARFAATTEAQWDSMAAMVRREIASGNTVPLDDVFPTRVSKL